MNKTEIFLYGFICGVVVCGLVIAGALWWHERKDL